MTTKNPVGRPSELTAELIERAREYLMGGYESVGEVVPNIAGLACYLGKSRSTAYEYAEQSNEFSDILESILAMQESKLISGGLKNEYNATITKLMLTKHGYSDKQEVDNKSSDGSMSTTKVDLTNATDEELELYERLATLRSERNQARKEQA